MDLTRETGKRNTNHPFAGESDLFFCPEEGCIKSSTILISGKTFGLWQTQVCPGT